ncbi:MAG: C-GCAxxG-C-C family protein [Spirochaetia bacterium]|nr:C-GCAxxG-C-C family protein [Spirochaetia bacterium]
MVSLIGGNIKTKEEYIEIAQNNFRSGYNCSQAVLCTFAEELGLDKAAAEKLAFPFGGGIGGMREVCGAVSGMCMCAGLKFGDKENKKEHYMRIQDLAKKFAEKSGNSIICRELLGLAPKKASLEPDKNCAAPRTDEYYKKRPCVELVGEAAGIVADMLAEK